MVDGNITNQTQHPVCAAAALQCSSITHGPAAWVAAFTKWAPTATKAMGASSLNVTRWAPTSPIGQAAERVDDDGNRRKKENVPHGGAKNSRSKSPRPVCSYRRVATEMRHKSCLWPPDPTIMEMAPQPGAGENVPSAGRRTEGAAAGGGELRKQRRTCGSAPSNRCNAAAVAVLRARAPCGPGVPQSGRPLRSRHGRPSRQEFGDR